MLERRHITVSREGWYYLLVVLFIVGGAVLREVNLLLVLAGMLIAPLVFHWRLVSLMLRRLEVGRKLPGRVTSGEPLLVEITARNSRTRLGTWALVVEDRVQLEGDSGEQQQACVEVMFPYLAAGQRGMASYRSCLTRRGRYRLGPLTLSTRFPLGLIRARMTVEQFDSVVVYPHLGRLARDWMRRMESEWAGSQRSRPRRGLLEGDYFGLREWRTGDSRRWIHWRTSAKISNLAVRQFEQQRSQDLALVVDLWQPSAPSPDQTGAVELAVSFCATAVADLCRRGGNHLTVAVAGQSWHCWSAPGSNIFEHEVLEQLAMVQGGEAGRDSDVWQQLRQHSRPGMPRIIISTRSADRCPWHAELQKEASEGHRSSGPLLWIDVRSERLAQFYSLQ